MLLAALSIFITDPSMDWIKDIQRQKNDNLGNERIRTVEDKLACLDPTEIIVSLLDKIFRDKSISKKICQVRKFSLREKVSLRHKVTVTNILFYWIQ